MPSMIPPKYSKKTCELPFLALYSYDRGHNQNHPLCYCRDILLLLTAFVLTALWRAAKSTALHRDK